MDKSHLAAAPTPFEQFTENMKKILSVSKKESDEALEREMAERKNRKPRAKK